jgi:hypothetical protein
MLINISPTAWIVTSAHSYKIYLLKTLSVCKIAYSILRREFKGSFNYGYGIIQYNSTDEI